MHTYNMEMAWKAVVVLLAMATVTLMQQQAEGEMDRWCMNQLAACADNLNETGKDVPSSCCDPLKEVIESDPECICSMISNKGASQAERAGINITQAQQLPARCGIRINPLGCITAAAAGPSSSSDSCWSRTSLSPWFTLVASLTTAALGLGGSLAY